MKFRKIVALMILPVMLVLASCGATENKTAEKRNDGKLRVYTSFYAMYDFAKMIGGDTADIKVMCPIGSEPHEYEPQTADIAGLMNADIFIYNGAGMESWTDKVKETLKGSEVITLEASAGVKKTLASDPHIWLDPSNALTEMNAIKDAFEKAAPENRDIYEKNYNDCKAKTDSLISAWKTRVASFKNKNIVVSHEAYGYMCKAFGLNQVSICSYSADEDPSPGHMAEIVDFIRKEKVKYIFAEELQTTKAIDTVAKEAGVSVRELNPFEGDEEERDYFTVMEDNLDVLAEALAE